MKKWLDRYDKGGQAPARDNTTVYRNVLPISMPQPKPAYINPTPDYKDSEWYKQESEDFKTRRNITQPVLHAADVATDVMQLGNFIPLPQAQAIARTGNILGALVDSYQAGDAFVNKDYNAATMNAAAALLPLYMRRNEFARDMYNTIPGSLADKIASYGSRNGTYLPLSGVRKNLIKNPIMRKAVDNNKKTFGALLTETGYDSYAEGGENNTWLEKYVDGGPSLDNLKSQFLQQYGPQVQADNTRLGTQKANVTNAQAQQLEKDAVIHAQRAAEERARLTNARKTMDNESVPFTFPTGETKKWADMDFREKNYVRGQSLRTKGRLNETGKETLLDYVNPINWYSNMAANAAEAAYVAKQTDSNIPYLAALAEPLLAGRTIGSGTINPLTKNFYTHTVSDANFNNNLLGGIPRLLIKGGRKLNEIPFVYENLTALDDHLKGLKLGLFKDKRPFFEKFPITKNQRAAVFTAQDEALKEADDFLMRYYYNNTDELHPDIRNKLMLQDPGYIPHINDNVDLDHINNPFQLSKSELVNVRRKSLKNMPFDVQQYYLKERNNIAGVNISNANAYTNRNRGFYYYSPEWIRDVGTHEGVHTAQKFQARNAFEPIINNINKFDPSQHLYTFANPDSEEGRQFAEVMINPIKNKYTWHASPLELHADYIEGKGKLYRAYLQEGATPEELLGENGYLRNPTPEMKDWIIKTQGLNNFFKKEADEASKHKLLDYFQKGGQTYTIQPGDNLSSVAQKYGVSLRRLVDANNISNPDFIRANQTLVIPNTLNQKPESVYQDWESIKNRQNKINAFTGNDAYSPDEQIITQYYKNRPDDTYLVVDKKRARMNLYKGNQLQKTYEVGTGVNPGDAQTVTRVKDINNDGIINNKDKVNNQYITDWEGGNKSTGAGVYTISRVDPKSKEYYDLPSFNLLNDQGVEVATSIHGTPMGRRVKFNDNNVFNNRMSNGCINGKCYDLEDLYKKVDVGNNVYILPEDLGNRFELVDGKPVLRVDSKNRSKYNTYVDQLGNVRKGQGINQSVNTLNYKPIRGLFDKKSFIDNVYQWNDANDENEYQSTTKPFYTALVNNKQRIMKEAKIPSDVYNEIARMSFGIYGTESNFGDTHSAAGNLLRAVKKVITPGSSSSPDYKSKFNTYGANEDTRSVGLTQLRWSYLSDDEKRVLKNLGITSNADFLNPEKAAIGTTAVLGMRYNQQLTSEQKKDIWKNLPSKWNKRGNYGDRVKSNSRYLTFQQLDEKKEGGPIVDPRGQWNHPGKDTIVPTPNGHITMQGVPYPVYGQDETGYGQMMYPNHEYTFSGQMVYETPVMGSGGEHGGLDRWFAEKWVDVKTGKQCGRQEGEKRRGYPACRPSKRVSSETPKTASELSSSEKEKFKRNKTSSKRISYQHRRMEDGGQIHNWREVEVPHTKNQLSGWLDKL